MGRCLPIMAVFTLAATGWGAPAQTAEPLPARQVAKEYAENKAAAMAKYAGKPILLAGTIGRINLDQFGLDNMVLDGDSTLRGGLLAWLTTGESARTVAVGQSVVLRCEMMKDNDIAESCRFAK
jgi:hypothetical protein